MDFLHRFVGDLGATIAAGNVVIGHRLGLYQALAGQPATADDLAARTAVRPALRRGMAARAGGRRLRHLRRRRRHVLADRGAGVRAGRSGRRGVRTGRVRAGPRARCRPSRGSPRRSAPAPASAGTSTTTTCSSAASSSSAPATIANLVAGLDPGARRRRGQADGRREGGRHRLRARGVDDPARRAVPAEPRDRAATTTTGPIELARKRAADAGVADRITFEVASAQTFAGTGYDLVTTFDCLHDMGDPVGAARAHPPGRSTPTAPG